MYTRSMNKENRASPDPHLPIDPYYRSRGGHVEARGRTGAGRSIIDRGAAVRDSNNQNFAPTSYRDPAGFARSATVGNLHRPVQKRTRWSPADENRLIALIGQHGTSWATIESRGGFQVIRGQVALKDKARNMKAVYLK